MEDNYYEMSKAWRQLDESWTAPVKPILEKKKVSPFKKKVLKENVGAAAPGGMTGSGAPNIAGKAVIPSQQPEVKQAGFAAQLGQKPKKEGFDIATLGGEGPRDDIAPIEPIGAEMGGDTESPAVSDIIAAIQARYPGAIVEISVTAPDGHRFTDEDVACATEVANASEAPEELGGAWAKNEVEGEEDSEEGTKPLKEGAYGFPSKDTDEGGEEEDEKEEPEEAGEDEEKEEPKKPSFGGEKEEAGEGEEGKVSSCAGITQDCIALSPEGWSSFLVKADSQPMGGEEEGEMDESGNTEPNPDADPAVQDQVAKDQAKVAKAGKAGTLGQPKKPLPVDPTDRI